MLNNFTEILLRSLCLFIISLVFIRFMGKRNLSKIAPFHYVSFSVVAIISALISVKIIINLVYGITALLVWALLPIILDFISLKSKWVHDLVNGTPTVLVKQGKVLEENLKKERITGEELLRELRHKEAFSLSDVEFALMETSGDINLLKKADKAPITANDLKLNISAQAEPQTVILDGKVLNDNLAALGLNQGWLNLQLTNLEVATDNVYLAQVDSSGELYIDLYDDSIMIPQPKVREMLYANLEKCLADLLNYSLKCKDPNVKNMYSKNAEKLKTLINKLEPVLLN